jgi:hypothetical protein
MTFLECHPRFFLRKGRPFPEKNLDSSLGQGGRFLGAILINSRAHCFSDPESSRMTLKKHPSSIPNLCCHPSNILLLQKCRGCHLINGLTSLPVGSSLALKKRNTCNQEESKLALKERPVCHPEYSRVPLKTTSCPPEDSVVAPGTRLHCPPECSWVALKKPLPCHPEYSFFAPRKRPPCSTEFECGT